jgi:transcription elongation factor Elf1
VTEPLDINEMKRPRRRFNRVLLGALACPLCGRELSSLKPEDRNSDSVASGGKIIYRRNSVSIKCGHCGMRFSVNPLHMAETIERRPDPYSERDLGNGHPQRDARRLRMLDDWNGSMRPRKRFRMSG